MAQRGRPSRRDELKQTAVRAGTSENLWGFLLQARQALARVASIHRRSRGRDRLPPRNIHAAPAAGSPRRVRDPAPATGINRQRSDGSPVAAAGPPVGSRRGHIAAVRGRPARRSTSATGLRRNKRRAEGSVLGHAAWLGAYQAALAPERYREQMRRHQVSAFIVNDPRIDDRRLAALADEGSDRGRAGAGTAIQSTWF